MKLDLTPTIEGYALTQKDLRALREADKICCDHSPELKGIRCIKDGNPNDPFDDGKTYYIPVQSEIKMSSAYPYRKDEEYNYGYEMLWRYPDSPLETILWLLRPGDVLSLEWRPDYGTNGYVERAGLHADELRWIVKRPYRGKVKKLTFVVSRSVCANNTARLVRRQRW